jgi:hypothetical protein
MRSWCAVYCTFSVPTTIALQWINNMGTPNVETMGRTAVSGFSQTCETYSQLMIQKYS